MERGATLHPSGERDAMAWTEVLELGCEECLRWVLERKWWRIEAGPVRTDLASSPSSMYLSREDVVRGLVLP